MKRKILIILIFLWIHLLCFYSFSQDLKPNRIGNWYIVVGDKINVRAEPDLTSNILIKINIASTVTILKKSNKKISTEGKEGEWVYVNTHFYKNIGDNETVKGWVFDYYLSDLSNFKRVTNFEECYIEGWVGDYLMSYQIYKDGRYKRKVYKYDELPGKNDRFLNETGTLYRYRNVIFANDDDNKGHEIFHINDQGILCSNYSDVSMPKSKGTRICAKPGRNKDIEVKEKK